LGKYRVFIFGSVLSMVMVLIFTHLSISPLWEVLVLNTLTYTAVMSRMIPTQALISGVPEMKDRGAFMSINSSIQQLGGGIASVVGGWLIAQDTAGRLLRYDVLGYVTIGAFITCALLMYYVNRHMTQKMQLSAQRV